ncbi:hypothetical protein TNIN_483991 [Trichonephila inaurata madagascariensis]|uniref:Uncharacterized protein n=1 Tax=Trichonephila inaurata madagascariensis TaxID=2747483 RepID=A0A8X6WZZ4_9ARAC|nr:hypothetical protein TNIN_483991 [Trichonephila inaurata madagascariensis]
MVFKNEITSFVKFLDPYLISKVQEEHKNYLLINILYVLSPNISAAEPDLGNLPLAKVVKKEQTASANTERELTLPPKEIFHPHKLFHYHPKLKVTSSLGAIHQLANRLLN